jgi:asparagine synthase (glutamine-hydrolysing)
LSGIAAVIRFDGGSVDPGTVEKMTAAMAYRGPDGIAHWTDGQAALGHCQMHTTAESLEEAQPLANEDQSLVLVMDGWLANPEELRSELLSRGARLRTRSDAELVLRAFEAWGEDCPTHIDGEYAFLIWDQRRREAFCARDHAGMKPLHYHWDGHRLLVASDIAGIMALADVERRINRTMIAEHIGNDWHSLTETVWEGVTRLVQAHWLQVGASGLRSQRYWLPPLEPTLSYKHEADYFEHYRVLLADSIRRASRTHLPLGCEVSGGLDSSSIYCMALDQLGEGKLLAPALKGYTYLFDPPDEGCDEIGFARAVARHTGTVIREVPAFLPDLDWFEQRGRDDCDVAPYCNAAMAVNIGKAATADGCRVVFNGEGGDEFQTGKPFYFHEQLVSGDLAEFWHSLREDAADLGWPDALRNAAYYGLGPCTPAPVKWMRRKLLERRRPNHYLNAQYLPQEFEDMLLQRRSLIDCPGFMQYRNMANRALFMSMHDAFIVYMRDNMARQCARGGYQLRSPMYARSLIEFSFAMPERMKLRGATTKYTLKRALGPLLPEVIASRQTKAHFNIAFDRLLDNMEEYLTVVLPQSGAWNLDAQGMAKIYRAYCAGPLATKPVWELWEAYTCEKLTALQDRPIN